MTQENMAFRQERNLTEFNKKLERNSHWHVFPAGESDPKKAAGLFVVQDCQYYPAPSDLRDFLIKHPFAYVRGVTGKKNLAILDSNTLLLWNNEDSDYGYTLVQGIKEIENKNKKLQWAGLDSWRLPSKEMLARFAKNDANPYRAGIDHRLAQANGTDQAYWLTIGGICDVDKASWRTLEGDATGCIFACNSYWDHQREPEKESAKENTLESVKELWVRHGVYLSLRGMAFSARTLNPISNIIGSVPCIQIVIDLSTKGWKLVAPDGETFPDGQWNAIKNSTKLKLLELLAINNQILRAELSKEVIEIDPRDYLIDMQLIELDFKPCRLPKLETTQLTDPGMGLWELWGEDPETLKSFNCVGRDPWRDVQRRAVAIDFGTSSTVVAMDTPNDARELLRIGVRDFFEPVRAQHFENPTVLECADYPSFFAAWTANAYRPALNWDWMRAAHEAQARFRDNPGDTKILSSILPRLKQWALRSAESRRVRLTDQHEHEMELAPLSERNPARGQPLAVSEGDPFDPVELYAWYLGMAINWRGRGLFLKYYLSFPVKYPREVRERVLASFRRGLQRSLPDSLIRHHPQVLNDFEVAELASEPAAYAAAALPHLGVQPTEVGVPYAVFDFGGGTSDFDYGLLRWATPEEEAQGYERVYEHLASDGDNFLGGENLLEHLVYESFKHNLDELRKKRIQFTQPIDALPFAGSEAFLAPTQAAQTNAVMLAAKLRDFMEKDKPELTSPIKLDLLDANGNKQTCELVLDVKSLDSFLASRMRRGVEAFLAGLARVHSGLPAGATIQLLLAGNGSRSRHIKALFDPQSPMWQELLSQAFGNGQENWSGDVPEIVVHPPFPMDDTKPHAPTSKTGVALGLLRLVPGEGTLTTSHLHAANDGQAPFAWFIGRLRRGRFDPIILPNMPYGVWRELGPLQQGVFNMYASLSPRAHNGLADGDPELKKHRLDFPAAPTGSRVFARAVKPQLLELAAAPDEATLEGLAVMTFPLE